MITIYGIKNCDTMQKAMRWLDAQKLTYQFHNYKEKGIDEATLQYWLQYFPADKLINTKGITWRALPDVDKAGINTRSKAIELMTGNTSLIKRPVWDLGNDTLYLGWNEAELTKLIMPHT